MSKLSERLEAEAASWESWNRDFPEDQSPLTPVLLREAAALCKRYEDAPVEEARGFDDLQGKPIGCLISAPYEFHGQRVRLVVEGEP